MKPLVISLLIVLTFITCTTKKSQQRTYRENIVHQPFDAIIVPGIPYDGKKWSDVMCLRVLWSKFLYDRGYTKNIIYSGGAVYSPYKESRIMALYAEALGVPKAHIFTEETARHSTENVYYSYYLAKSKGFNNIAVATDPFQTSNLKSYIRKYNFGIKILPTVFDTVATLDHTEPKIDPRSAMVDSTTFKSIKRESLLKRLRGTMGKNIPYTAEDKARRKAK
jgi:uncharacterized SAM-binding protein YcdF (DUF218 family)